MKNENKIRIFLVDDDIVFLKSLEIEFLQLDTFIVETYVTGELCIENLSHKPDIIILDYLLDGIDKNAMNGIQALDEIKTFDAKIPVIMLSQQDRIDVAVICMHHKAYDYVVKSETAFLRLQQIISTIFKYHKMENELNWYMDRM
ncbi:MULTISPECIES: response regulator [unclassified Arcicella]|uniref:response regulator n=1 Tax=unclassified Arcicella TaxID=2644986 RepID=UPI0028553F04|nr:MULTISPECIES: response regulator [unclassified Arcicella]MDR6564291.1 DNA-binding NtrC family response regulator [Arcicella sp. BE51]MDR6811462.1 DNA-binding NtrC family response regulator [Arcicella sp. BE140]MDR6826002.1 DNA-binding NtrC family response regulator [Arcicella sp. BE139]